MNAAKGLIIFTLLLCVSGKIRKNYVGALNKGLLNRGVSLNAGVGAADPQYFTQQLLNHFDYADNTTWTQKYYVNATFWTMGNPIFLMLGGEGPLGASSVGDHYILGTYAPIYGAMLVSLEHRFYGESIPKNSSSVDNLRLLNAQQALADAVYFRYWFTDLYKTPNSKWIVFGGSYSGALSAWARNKYPHVFQGSVASSGPVNAVEDFNQYLQVTANSLGTQCSSIIKKGTDSIENLLQTQTGKQQLQTTFNTCSAIQTDKDATTFLEDISDAICEVVQYNKDNRGTNALTIDQICQIFIDGQNDPVTAWATVYHKVMGSDCVEVDYNVMIKELGPTSAGRCWTWQTCTEYGYYQTGELTTQPFSPRINLQYFRDICQDLFGPMRVSPDTSSLNSQFGALNLKQTASNTFFGDGTIDPWHALAILPTGNNPGQEILPLNSAIALINGTAHCADLYAPSSSDLPELTFARQLTMDLITQWLK